ncbi:GSCFA domain-containing protein [Nemorincola caseinilytica]|uniref:GSCFA domain-containing protein n=1 Tax=Nemorincola caseinilytica TaxID=2054315 RepID=A0ABP8NAP9_9BACT
MQMMLSLDIPPLPGPITYTDNILLIGSCFTEHMADRLQHYKFHVLQNPHGILFNPLSVAQSLDSYISGERYTEADLFYLNELWNSWDHHTRFSHTDKTAALAGINRAQEEAAAFIRKADKVIITLGSAFQYYLRESGKHVANNHRAPAQWFEKRLLPIEEIVAALNGTIQRLQTANPYAKVIFTISPVRHIRDGVVDNNRSKARLLEAVHELCGMHEHAYYFPAYELVIDILRDHRYYDIDMVHPNFAATTFVWEHFMKACIDPAIHDVMKQVGEIMTARAHRTRFPDTNAHRKFMESYLAKCKALAERYPMLDMKEEIAYFEMR